MDQGIFSSRVFSDMFSLSKVLLSQFYDILIAVDENFPISPRGVESSFPELAQEAIRNIQKVCCREVIGVFWLYHVLGFAILEVLQSIASSVTFF